MKTHMRWGVIATLICFNVVTAEAKGRLDMLSRIFRIGVNVSTTKVTKDKLTCTSVAVGIGSGDGEHAGDLKQNQNQIASVIHEWKNPIDKSGDDEVTAKKVELTPPHLTDDNKMTKEAVNNLTIDFLKKAGEGAAIDVFSADPNAQDYTVKLASRFNPTMINAKMMDLYKAFSKSLPADFVSYLEKNKNIFFYSAAKTIKILVDNKHKGAEGAVGTYKEENKKRPTWINWNLLKSSGEEDGDASFDSVKLDDGLTQKFNVLYKTVKYRQLEEEFFTLYVADVCMTISQSQRQGKHNTFQLSTEHYKAELEDTMKQIFSGADALQLIEKTSEKIAQREGEIIECDVKPELFKVLNAEPPAAPKPSEKAPEKVTKKPTEKATEKVTKKPTEKPPAATKTTEKAPAAAKTTEKAPAAAKAPVAADDAPVAAKAPEKAPVAAKAPEKAPEKAPVAAKAPEKAPAATKAPAAAKSPAPAKSPEKVPAAADEAAVAAEGAGESLAEPPTE